MPLVAVAQVLLVAVAETGLMLPLLPLVAQAAMV
jgi:hypothetical protein